MLDNLEKYLNFSKIFHFCQAGSSRRIKNFTDDIKDSEVYTELIKQIAPEGSGVNKQVSCDWWTAVT